ncbi:MAG: hypothetical protein WBG17_08480 [Burkholderiaceae bacterium]
MTDTPLYPLQPAEKLVRPQYPVQYLADQAGALQRDHADADVALPELIEDSHCDLLREFVASWRVSLSVQAR